MFKTGKLLSMIIVLAIILLYAVSPSYADEITGPTEGGTEMAAPADVSEDAGETTGADAAADQGAGADAAADQGAEADAAADQGAGAGADAAADQGAGADAAADQGAGAGAAADQGAGADAVEEIVAPAPEISEAEPLAGPEATESDAEFRSSEVLSVALPATVSITIDPFEIAGKGQVYSDNYEVRNYSDTDVLLTFTDIEVSFTDGENFEPLAKPFDDRMSSKLKSIYLVLDFGRDNVPSAVITDPDQASEISMPLAARTATDRSFVTLSFSGSVNHLPDVPWQDGDVKINMTYRLDAIPPPVDADVQLLTGNGEEIPESTSTPESIDAPIPESPSAESPSAESPEEPAEDKATIAPSDGAPQDEAVTNPSSESGSSNPTVPSETVSSDPEPPPETAPSEHDPPPEATPSQDTNPLIQETP